MKKLIQIHIEEACEECKLSIEVIRKFILEEWIKPSDPEELLFDQEDLARIHLILELQDDFGVNDEAVPIILQLLDQLHSLRGTVSRLNR